jgi:hypothetical protein
LAGTQARAATIIKQPGNHPDYAVELEPHLLLQWDRSPWYQEEGFGLGGRVSIPFLDNGPISTINNNMAIGFGLDWAHFSNAHGWCWDGNPYAGWTNYGCTANSVWFPVVLQWNFFLTDVISVFGEPGLAIRHDWWSGYWPCPYSRNVACPYDNSETDFAWFVVWGGARFMFSENIGAVVRIGTPSLSAGITFLL